MPPKKKPSAKGAEVTDKELLTRAQAEIVALNRLLELKTYEVQQHARFGGAAAAAAGYLAGPQVR